MPALLCVNKYDLNIEETRAMKAFAKERGAKAMGRIPFDPLFTKSMVQGKTLFEYDGDSDAARAVRTVWTAVADRLEI